MVPEQVLRPIQGPAWGYRLRARLSVRYVGRKGTVLVGFHERKSRYVADMTQCPVLPAKVSALLPHLRELIGSMAARDRLPQIELAMGDEVCALVLRHLDALADPIATACGVLVPRMACNGGCSRGDPTARQPLDADGESLVLSRCPSSHLTMPFRPTDFTQVNLRINRVLVSQAVRHLDPAPDER